MIDERDPSFHKDILILFVFFAVVIPFGGVLISNHSDVSILSACGWFTCLLVLIFSYYYRHHIRFKLTDIIRRKQSWDIAVARRCAGTDGQVHVHGTLVLWTDVVGFDAQKIHELTELAQWVLENIAGEASLQFSKKDWREWLKNLPPELVWQKE